jgi:hypothetical protein
VCRGSAILRVGKVATLRRWMTRAHVTVSTCS